MARTSASIARSGSIEMCAHMLPAADHDAARRSERVIDADRMFHTLLHTGS